MTEKTEGRNSASYLGLVEDLPMVLSPFIVLYSSLILLNKYESFFTPALWMVLKMLWGVTIFTLAALVLARKTHVHVMRGVNLSDHTKSAIALRAAISILLGAVLAGERTIYQPWIAWLLNSQFGNFGFRDLVFATKNIFVLILALWVAHALGEELFFRGFLLNYLRKFFSERTAVVLSSILFSLAHLPYSFEFFVWIFVVGVFAAELYLTYKSMVYPVLFHSLLNAWGHILVLHRDTLSSQVALITAGLSAVLGAFLIVDSGLAERVGPLYSRAWKLGFMRRRPS